MIAKQSNGQSSVFQAAVRADHPAQVWNSGESFLDFHRLTSYWFAEHPTALPPGDFAGLVKGLPGLGRESLKEAICVLVFVEGRVAEPGQLIDQSVYGSAVYSREAEGLKCTYFRRSGDAQAFQLVQTLDAVGCSVVSSDEITMLHFASFDRVPRDSGIYFFRRALTEQETTELGEMSKLPGRVQLDDAVCGDRHLNGGVAYLQKPPVPESCGVPCTAGGGSMFYCALEPWSGTRYCKLATETCGGDDLALALANQAAPGGVPESARRLLAHLTSFRALRDNVLRESPGGRKYLGYYRLMSRHLNLDASMVKKLAALMPHVYKAVDALVYGGSNDVVVVQEAMFVRVESVLESLGDTDSEALRRALADVRADLTAVRGMTKAELSAYFGRDERRDQA